MVYVLSCDGQPLMPTENHAKVRVLLKQNKAKVIKRCPFIIQLLYDSTNHTQEINLGIDAGSKVIGLSASTESKELYSAEVVLRNDIVDLISTRREMRSSRRNRKTRYRKPRFMNRVHSKNKRWLAPSVEQKIATHLKVVENVTKILPVSKIIVETAVFDLQKIKAMENGTNLPQGTDYQHGPQLDFWNVREYVLWRDGHICQCCKGKSKDKILNVHHIESRKTGGDAPGNLITLCEYCHKMYHLGKVTLNLKRRPSHRDATFMGIMRWTLYNRLKERYGNVHMTYGYITKNTRIENGLPKEHRIDALCIAGRPTAVLVTEWFYQKKVRCHNRQIHKMTISKGGIRKRNQAPYEVKGFRLFDKVRYNGREYFIFGRRSSGFFDIRTLDGEKLNNGSISCKKLALLEKQKYYLTERRKGSHLTAKVTSVRT